jgi:molecular chaperone DnaK
MSKIEQPTTAIGEMNISNSMGIVPSVQAVGIDLGTTFSVIAIVDQKGQAQALPNAEGSPTTPSVAIWHQGAFVVGQPALDLVKNAPPAMRAAMTTDLIRGVKRMIGQPPAGGLNSGGQRTTPIEVSAAILGKLARDASSYLGFHVKDAVITVPAHFGDRERNATKVAAEMAGLHVLQVMNEPSAAALTYSVGKEVTPGNALVFDLGGGTFDVTVLRQEKTEARVLATQGIDELGGINFTNKLATELQRRYQLAVGKPYPDDLLASHILLDAAERAKCQLSDEQVVTIQLAPPGLAAATIQVTRQQFERLINLYMTQLQTAVDIALEHAKKAPSEVGRVLLCGGSSRIPAVQRALEEIFGYPPERILDLDLSVALGAAYQALNCEQAQRANVPSSGLQLLPGGLIIDCVSYPVGIAVMDAQGSRLVKLVLLQKGDPLNAWSDEYAVRLASGSAQFPPIRVYKGEGEHPEKADFLGDIVVALPPGIPPGTRATVRMLQDQSGFVQIQIAINEQDVRGSLRRA